MNRSTLYLCPTGQNQDLYKDIELNTNAGTDLRFAADVVIPPLGADGLPTKVSLQVRARIYAPNVLNFALYSAFLLYPRSSIAKTPLSLANSVGVFDDDYVGEVIVALRNHSSLPYTVARGTSLFQIVYPDMRHTQVKVVGADHKAFAATERGAGGFGSTGAGGV